MQSARTLQPWPLAHVGFPVLPQSMPVSLPFFAPSVFVGVWHTSPLPLSWQTSEMQSLATRHFLSTSQVFAIFPPQSMSVSSSFCAPSVGDGAMQRWLPVLQTLDAQSAFVLHDWTAAVVVPPSPPGATLLLLDELQPTPASAIIMGTARIAKAECFRGFTA